MTVWRGLEWGGGACFKGGSLCSAVLTVPSSGPACRSRAEPPDSPRDLVDGGAVGFACYLPAAGQHPSPERSARQEGGDLPECTCDDPHGNGPSSLARSCKLPRRACLPTCEASLGGTKAKVTIPWEAPQHIVNLTQGR